MLTGEMAVDPDRSLVVHRSEVKHDAAVLPSGGCLECAAIPYEGMERCIANAAHFALKTKWDNNVFCECFGGSSPVGVDSSIRIVEFKFPFAVQDHPLVALELGLRIF